MAKAPRFRSAEETVPELPLPASTFVFALEVPLRRVFAVALLLLLCRGGAGVQREQIRRRRRRKKKGTRGIMTVLLMLPGASKSVAQSQGNGTVGTKETDTTDPDSDEQEKITRPYCLLLHHDHDHQGHQDHRNHNSQTQEQRAPTHQTTQAPKNRGRSASCASCARPPHLFLGGHRHAFSAFRATAG